MSRKFDIGDEVTIVHTLPRNPVYHIGDEGVVVDYYPDLPSNGKDTIKPYAVEMSYGKEFIIEESEIELTEITDRLLEDAKISNT